MAGELVQRIMEAAVGKPQTISCFGGGEYLISANLSPCGPLLHVRVYEGKEPLPEALVHEKQILATDDVARMEHSVEEMLSGICPWGLSLELPKASAVPIPPPHREHDHPPS